MAALHKIKSKSDQSNNILKLDIKIRQLEFVSRSTSINKRYTTKRYCFAVILVFLTKNAVKCVFF